MAGGPANACATNDCSGSNNPNMQLTVTGASGTVNWAGETWNLPADSGVVKCVCPDQYTLTTRTTTGLTSEGLWEEEWKKYTPTSTSYYALKLRRWVQNYSVPPIQNVGNNQIDIFIGGYNRSTYSYNWQNMTGSTQTAGGGFAGIMIGGVPEHGLPSTVRLENRFFTSKVISGITYTWAKGINW
jgi:hypothetical protein